MKIKHDYTSKLKINDKVFIILLLFTVAMASGSILYLLSKITDIESLHYKIAQQKKFGIIDNYGNSYNIRIVDNREDLRKRITLMYIENLFGVSNNNYKKHTSFLEVYSSKKSGEQVKMILDKLLADAYYNDGKYNLSIQKNKLVDGYPYVQIQLRLTTKNKEMNKGIFIVKTKTIDTFPTKKNTVGIIINDVEYNKYDPKKYEDQEDIPWYKMI